MNETVTTTAMASNGQAVARTAAGKVVFVDGALPGEDVSVAILQEKSSYALGRVVEIDRPSQDRVEPPCPARLEGCGGCNWQHVASPAQRRMKIDMATEALSRLGRVDPGPAQPPVELAPWAHRTTLRAAVHEGRAALRRSRSHSLVPIDPCQIVHPLLRELITGDRYAGADEVMLRCGARTGDRLAATRPASAPARLPADVSRRSFSEEVAGRRWRISAHSFFQSRPDGADALADVVAGAAKEVGRPGLAVDLYSGVGLFAGVLADHGWSVVAVEGAASSVADARHNLKGAPVEVVRADVTRWAGRRADLVVADPSRIGLGRAGVVTVGACRPRRVVLISCDVASLGRDAGLLRAAGYGLAWWQLVDLFPHTHHVEVVSVFDRLTLDQ